MTKKKTAALVAALVALGSALVINNRRSRHYSAYFPSVLVQYRMLRPNCNDRGIAWAMGPNIKRDQNRLCAGWYESHPWDIWIDDPFSDPQFIPVARYVYMDKVEENLPTNWAGYVKLLNEPNLAGQDNLTPEEAAAFSCEFRAEWPLATLWLPNVVEAGPTHDLREYMTRFTAALACDLEPFQWGVHHYRFLLDETPSQTVDKLCSVVECRPGGVVVTEYGVHTGAQYAVMREWTINGRDDERIDKMFAFTNWNRWDPSTELIRNDGTITDYGRGFVAGR